MDEFTKDILTNDAAAKAVYRAGKAIGNEPAWAKDDAKRIFDLGDWGAFCAAVEAMD